MTQVNIFEQASRKKIRFETASGDLTIEQLWDLPLLSQRGTKVNLDAIAVELHRAIEAQGTESFVKSKKKDEILQLKFDVVKHIIDTKVAETEAKAAEQNRSAQLKKIDDAIERRNDADLAGKSADELLEMRSKILAGEKA